MVAVMQVDDLMDFGLRSVAELLEFHVLDHLSNFWLKRGPEPSVVRVVSESMRNWWS